MRDVLRPGIKVFVVPPVPRVPGYFAGERNLVEMTTTTPEVKKIMDQVEEVKALIKSLTEKNEELLRELEAELAANEILSQENVELRKAGTLGADVAGTISLGLEDILLSSVKNKEVNESNVPPVVEFSKVARPTAFDVVKNPGINKPFLTPAPRVRPVPKIGSDVKKPLGMSVNVSPVPSTPAAPKESEPSEETTSSLPTDLNMSPLPGVVDLTLLKKEEVEIKPVPSTESNTEAALKEVVEMSQEETVPIAVEKSLPPEREVKEDVEVAVEIPSPETAIPNPEEVKTNAVNSAAPYVKNLLEKTDPVNFANFNLVPGTLASSVVAPVENNTAQENKNNKFAHLSEAEKTRIYSSINTTLEEFYLKNLTTEEVVHLSGKAKPLSEADSLKIIPQIKGLNVYSLWHDDHTDQTIGNIDLDGVKINVRRNISSMILHIIRAGEPLGIDLTPKENITVENYFENSQKRISESIV